MKKKGITLITGVLCIGCLFCAYGLLKTENIKNEAEEEAQANKPILDLDTDNPASLSFDVGGTNVEFIYANATWSRTDDNTFPVNGDAVRDVLADLAALSAVRTLEEVEDTSEYGFEEPQNTFIYTDGDGTATTLIIGANNESTGDDYLLVDDGEEKVYTISTTLRSSISSDIYDYALAEELPDIMEEDIQAVTVEKSEGTYRIYKEGGIWYVEAEDGTILTAEEDTVESEVGSLGYSLSYADFVEHNCQDASVYGIDENSSVFTVQYLEERVEVETDAAAASGENAETQGDAGASAVNDETQGDAAASETEEYSELIFHIGTTDDAGNYYVQKEGSREVHTISADVLSAFLDVAAEDWEAEPETETEVAE